MPPRTHSVVSSKTFRLNRHAQQGRDAFTLVELLSVIAIIGVLVGILIPVVGSARDSARGTHCQSNLRQMYTALTLYTNDNKGFLPPGPNPTGSKGLTTAQHANYTTGASNNLTTHLAQYLGSTPPTASTERVCSIMACPSQPTPATASAYANARSYGILASATPPLYPFGYLNDRGPMRLTEITSTKNPSITWLIRDIDKTLSAYSANAAVVAERGHKKGRNYLYIDGHVSQLNQSQEDEQEAKRRAQG